MYRRDIILASTNRYLGDGEGMSEIGDISCRQLAMFFGACKAHYPISDRYIAEVHDSHDKVGRTEREHMSNWFRNNHRTATGPYSRSKENDSGRTCYQNLKNAASLLWIAEASGVDEQAIMSAFNAAVAAGDYRRACGAIRQIIPWETVYSSLSLKMKEDTERRSFTALSRKKRRSAYRKW